MSDQASSIIIKELNTHNKDYLVLLKAILAFLFDSIKTLDNTLMLFARVSGNGIMHRRVFLNKISRFTGHQISKLIHQTLF